MRLGSWVSGSCSAACTSFWLASASESASTPVRSRMRRSNNEATVAMPSVATVVTITSTASQRVSMPPALTAPQMLPSGKRAAAMPV